MAQLSVSSRSVTAPAIEQVVSFLKQLFPEPRFFGVRLWEGTLIPASGESRFVLVLNTSGALRRMLRPPLELNIGEAYIRGEFDIEGDFHAVFDLYDRLRTVTRTVGDLVKLARLWLALPTEHNPTSEIARGPARLPGQLHSKARDRAAIQYHYDVGNGFYALWLDKRMVYSCAYFPSGQEDIDTAQDRKLEHSCRKLRLKPGEKLLDIGCGWGGAVIYAAQHFGVSALGVTLSQEQCDLANKRIAEAGLVDRVTVVLQDYRDLADESFDKIVSIGMFEHVGRSHLPEYFTHAWRLLKPGGLFLNHGISVHPSVYRREDSPWTRFVSRRILGSGLFGARYIFPDGELIPVSEVNLLAEQAGFEVRDVENLREHYAMTLRHWANRLTERRTEAIAVANETLYRTWKLYLSAAAYGFESGEINVNQSLLTKPEHGYATLPLTRADLYTAS